METLKIRVKTKSGKSEILGFDDGKKAWLVNVKSAPEHGEANMEIIKLFHRKHKQPVRIISGATSKEKLVRIG